MILSTASFIALHLPPTKPSTERHQHRPNSENYCAQMLFAEHQTQPDDHGKQREIKRSTDKHLESVLPVFLALAGHDGYFACFWIASSSLCAAASLSAASILSARSRRSCCAHIASINAIPGGGSRG